MKKIIFKFFLISLFACLSFFSIDKVYAENKTLNVSGMSWYNHSGSSGDGSPSTYNINGATHYGRQLDVNSAKINFGYKILSFLPAGDYYDLDFILYSGIGANTEIIATFDNIVCSVNKTGQYYGTISNSNGVLKTGDTYSYAIHCESIYTHDGWSELSIYLPVSSSNITGNTIFAVNNTVAVNFGYKHFAEHDKNNLNQIKNSVNEINSKLGIGNADIKSSLDNINSNQQETNKKLDESNKLAKDKLEQDKKHHEEIMDDDTSGANGEAESFFSGFSTNTHGLTSIITAPLELIGNIAGSTCSPLQVPLPFVDTNLSLPCMSSIYKQYFGSFLSLYQIITFGIVAYWVCVRIFNLVKDFKNPDHDEIEVMDL